MNNKTYFCLKYYNPNAEYSFQSRVKEPIENRLCNDIVSINELT
jgi:hypothetical protein